MFFKYAALHHYVYRAWQLCIRRISSSATQRCFRSHAKAIGLKQCKLHVLSLTLRPAAPNARRAAAIKKRAPYRRSLHHAMQA